MNNQEAKRAMLYRKPVVCRMLDGRLSRFDRIKAIRYVLLADLYEPGGDMDDALDGQFAAYLELLDERCNCIVTTLANDVELEEPEEPEEQ